MTATRHPPSVLTLHAPEGEPVPLVLDSPHSGDHYPEDFDHAPPRAEVRAAEDAFVARLWQGATLSGATLLEAGFPRAYVDPNRSLDDLDPALLAQPWPQPLAPSRKTRQGIGLVWRFARDGAPMYARTLGVGEVQARIERYWQPYHETLARVLDEVHGRFGAVWHVNCHSMPSVGDRNADDPGRERADFVVGDRDGTTCEPGFTRLVVATLAALGYRVAVNDPYKGVEIVRRHGRPRENRHSLQIEVKRSLYMDERTLSPSQGFEPLRRNLARVAAAIAGYALRQAEFRPRT
jgi:N-formylglutamate deformylase